MENDCPGNIRKVAGTVVRVQVSVIAPGSFGETTLPGPCVAHGVVDVCLGFPAENFVGEPWICPDLHDVAFAAVSDPVRHFDPGGPFEQRYQFEH